MTYMTFAMKLTIFADDAKLFCYSRKSMTLSCKIYDKIWYDRRV